MLHLLMGQGEYDFHAFILHTEKKINEGESGTGEIYKSTWQSSQHCPWAQTASPLRVQVVALQHGFRHS